jgi:hypothetical protein
LPPSSPSTSPLPGRNAINMGDAVGPSVSFDGSGNGLAVWRQSDGSRFNIWASRYTPATGWGSAAPIESVSPANLSNPQLAMQPNGNATVWWAAGGTTLSARYTPSTGWGSATTGAIQAAAIPSLPPPGRVSLPTILLDAAGNATSVWDEFQVGLPGGNTFGGINVTSGFYSVWGNAASADGTWGAPLQIRSGTVRSKLAFEDLDPNTSNRTRTGSPGPRFGFDAVGNALAIWRADEGKKFEFARRVAGVWQATQVQPDDKIDDFITSDYALAVAPDGNAMAVFAAGSGRGIVAMRYVASTGWTTPSVLIQPTATFALQPKVVADGAGNMLAVWAQENGVWANRYSASTGWGIATQIQTTTITFVELSNLQLAMNPKGDALFTWRNSNGALWANYYTADTGWRTPTALSSEGEQGNNTTIKLAIDANGNATAVWDWFDGLRMNIVTNTYRR